MKDKTRVFISKSDFNLYIEKLKVENQFDTYIESIVYYITNESDLEPEQVVKHLNKKIIEEVRREANDLGMLKTQETIIGIL